ncbi:hypothetical protein U3A55_12355 [Salarchaeum sp. III]|uniref:hypothetical protein n=1 Tax=Salarchaeum sp. III TaxID=3107927 RepID=UPI002ED9AE31
MAALVVVSTVLGGVGFASAPAAASSNEVTTCGSSENVFGAIAGLFSNYGGTSAYSDGVTQPGVNPCYMDGNTVDGDTESETARRIAALALEDKAYTQQYFGQWDNYAQRLQNPAIGDARTEFTNAVYNGSDEIAAIFDAKAVAHDRVADQQYALWQYYTSQMNALANLKTQAVDGGVGDNIRVGHINESGQPEWGYNVMPITSPRTQVGAGGSSNITLASGEKIAVPAPFKVSGALENNTTFHTLDPRQDDVLVQVFDPESGGWSTVINIAEMKTEWNTVSTRTSITAGTVYDVNQSVGRISWGLGSATGVGITVNGVEIYTRDGYVTVDGQDVGGGSVYSVSVTETDGGLEIRGGGQLLTTLSSQTEIDTWSESSSAINSGNTQLATLEERVQVMGEYTNEFASRHQELEAVDNSVMDVLGDSSSGLLSKMFAQMESGNQSAATYRTSQWYLQHTMETSDRGSQAWLAAIMQQLGYSLSNVSSTVQVDVLAGSTVDGQTLNSTTTYSGWISTESQPPNGTWQNSKTYSVGSSSSDLQYPVHILYQDSSGSWVNGTYQSTTVAKRAVVSSGDITITSITNADGEEVEEADQHENDPSETNVSAILEQVQKNNELYKELMEQMDKDNDGNEEDANGGGGGGPDPASWFQQFVNDVTNAFTPDLGAVVPDLPYGLIGIGIAGFGLVLLVGPILLPIIIALWSRL